MKTLLTTLHTTNAVITNLAEITINNVELDDALYPYVEAFLSDKLELRQVSSIKDVPELDPDTNYFFVDKFSGNIEMIQGFARDWQEQYDQTLNLINIET